MPDSTTLLQVERFSLQAIDMMIDDSLRILIISGGLLSNSAASRLSGEAVEAALKQRFAHLAHVEIDDSLPQILDSFCPDVAFPVHLGDSGTVLLRSFLGDSIPCVGSNHYQDAVSNCDAGRKIFVAVLDFPVLRALPPIEAPPGEPDGNVMYLGCGPYICPALLPSNTLLEAQLVAMDAHRQNGCVDYSLTELQVTKAGVVAMGTINDPILTSKSLFGVAAMAEDIPFVDLCWLFVRQAASRALGVVDIGFKSPYPSNLLSNSADHKFIFDGVSCASVEGLIQALKFQDHDLQISVCGMAGKQAKLRGSDSNNTLQATQTLWWKGVPMSRSGADYQEFLDRVFFTLFDQSEVFKSALAKTGRRIITHSTRKHDPAKTVLTEHELVSRLTFLRKYLKSVQSGL